MNASVNSIFLIFFLVAGSAVSAQNLSNRGRAFWVGYGHHQFMEYGRGNRQEMVLYFSAEEAARVTVTIKGTSYRETYVVAANSVVASKPLPKGLEATTPSVIDSRLYNLPPSYGGSGSEGIFTNKGIHIESDVPIVAYAHIYGESSSGATMLMPVDTWGYSYTSLNTRQYFTSSSQSCFSWMYVVAAHANTRVRITPSVPTRSGMPANQAFDITLQEGDIYQVVAAQTSENGGYDLTGTAVQSIANAQGECYPVAVFSGSSRTTITCNESPDGSGDNIMQQIFPHQAWGRQYLTTPSLVDNNFRQFNMNVFRIVVSDPTTVVKKNGMTLYGLTNNLYYEYQSNTPDFIETDKPVLVAQYFPSQSACDYTGSGDPEMIYISPVEQAIKKTGFLRNDKESIAVNYLSLVIPDNGLPSLTIDGQQDFSVTYPHPNRPGYTIVVKRWPGKNAQCLVQSDSGFTAITYGLGVAESYGYNAGTLINNLSGVPFTRNAYNESDSANTYACLGTTVELSVLMRYQPEQLAWNLASLSGVLSPAENVVQANPVATEEVELNGIHYYRYALSGTYRFLKAGTYRVPVFATHPLVDVCDHTENIPFEITVQPAPEAGFVVQNESCQGDAPIGFEASANYADGGSIQDWKWEFTGGSLSQSASGQAVSARFEQGSYQARLLAISSNGCAAETVQPFSVALRPARPDFSLDAVLPCTGADILLKEDAPDPQVKSWYWDFGDGEAIDLSANGYTQTKQFMKAGSITVRHVVRYDNNCASDTAQQTIILGRGPEPDLALGNDCLPEDGKFVFQNNTVSADGGPLQHYWNFGDSEAGAGNPNESDAASPSHVFASSSYTIRYQVSSQLGCRTDTSFTMRFKRSPAATYTPAGPMSWCVSEKGPVNLAFGSITNGVNGSGIYFGAGLTTAGQLSPAAAGVGQHQGGYIAVSDEGCRDTTRFGFEVKPVPQVSAGPDLQVRAGNSIQLNGKVTGLASATWRWEPAALLSDAGSLTPVYNATREQQFVLSASDANGSCTSSDTMAVYLLQAVTVPNVFSPNQDGIHDRWEIPNLAAYKDCTVEVFNRYGQQVFSSRGYTNPWNGTSNGKPLPAGTYYYLIQLQHGFGRLSGSVTLIR